MAGLKAFQRVNYGFESTEGTAVAASKQFRGNGGMIADLRTIQHPEELTSVGVPTTRMYTPQLLAGMSMASTPATFEQLPVILTAGIEKIESGVQDGSGTDYIYDFDMPTTALNTISTLTLESGDNQQFEEAEYCFVTDFSLTGNAGEAVMMASNWRGRQAEKTTATSATIPSVEEILAGKGAVYIDDGDGTIGTTQVSQAILNFGLNVTTGWKPKFFIDGNALYFSRHYYDIGAVAIELSLTFEHDATGVAAKDDWRAETEKLIRLDFTGSAVTTGGTTYSNKKLIIDVVGQYTNIEPLSDQEGNSIYQATFRGAYSPTAAITPLSMTVVNELSSL